MNGAIIYRTNQTALKDLDPRMKLWQKIKQAAQPQSSAFQYLMLVVTLLLVFLMASRSPTDPDMWWHLRAGEETIKGGRPLVVDTMTFTMSGEPWVNHSWLSQVVLYLLYDWWGYLGLSLYVAVLVTATMYFLYRSLKGGVFLRSVIVVLVCAVMARVWAPRPQLFSLLLFAGLNEWLQLYQQRKTTTIWPLALVFVLWSNLHGGYSFGFMLLGITLVGMMFDRLFRPEHERTMTWREIGRLADWTAISLLAVLLNPNGLSTWKIPFQTVGVAVTEYIQEWESMNFHDISSMPYLVLLFATLVAIGLSSKRATAPELAGLTLFGVSSLMAQRLIGIFALFAAVVLARHSHDAIRSIGAHLRTTQAGARFENWRVNRKSKEISPAIRKTINLTLVAVLALAGLIKLIYVSQPILVEKHLAEYYPAGAVNYMQENGNPGNILSDYGWGGYLDWHLRENKVYFDGRADLYSDELFYAWLDLISAKPGWEETLAGYNVRYILLPPEMELVEKAEETGWEVLYSDEVSVLLQRHPVN